MWAPTNIKIDGKYDDWGSFKAFNSTIGTSYSIANDSSNIYVIINAKDRYVIDRMINGGVSFTLSKMYKKPGFQVTYPVVERSLYFGLFKKKSGSEKGYKGDDSTITAYNQVLIKNCKSISIFKTSQMDTLISIYNDDGIKTNILFDQSTTLTYELSIPIKTLNAFINKDAKFNYQIKINGLRNLKGIAGNEIKLLSSTNPTNDASNALAERFLAGMNSYVDKQSAATDFWGEYTLAKKP